MNAVLCFCLFVWDSDSPQLHTGLNITQTIPFFTIHEFHFTCYLTLLNIIYNEFAIIYYVALIYMFEFVCLFVLCPIKNCIEPSLSPWLSRLRGIQWHHKYSVSPVFCQYFSTWRSFITFSFANIQIRQFLIQNCKKKLLKISLALYFLWWGIILKIGCTFEGGGF